MNYRRLLIVVAWFVFSAAASIGYYVNEIRIARNESPKVLAQAWQTYGKRITLRDLSMERLQWLLAIEDPTFFVHHGVDLYTPGAGMTTISQSLVKLLYFPNGFHKGIAKIRQTLIARYAFDALVPKEEQLELLLNAAYLGHPNGVAIYGFSDAAKVYYHKDFNALSDEEFKLLVAMLAGPDHFVPGSPELAERVTRIGAYLSGEYRPASVLDTEYVGKTRGSLGEEIFMAILRLATGAKQQIQAVSATGLVLPVIPSGSLQ
ncbi:transglycosylase domain-containing protein [Methylomonas sp. UP202]|uniref:transglycosylase domain-containing protein n=1 Tax=Methylomonas sp. UP202 TaxID=3040943 RepID=UPI002479D296|nr:transglycosylase domain-containing protein [Methylomonas sp. UP202]WGS84032.1 transglycosylase domain-containing protein [Methylomonas sp. UP202]